jgi:hypothetical protein
MNVEPLLGLFVGQLAFFNLIDNGQIRGQRVIAQRSLHTLFVLDLRKFETGGVNLIQDGTSETKKPPESGGLLEGACTLGCYLIFSDAFRFFEYFALAFDGPRRCSAISGALCSIRVVSEKGR